MIIFFCLQDIFFLNRESKRNVKSAEELIPIFAVPPSGKWKNNKPKQLINLEYIILLFQDLHRLLVFFDMFYKKNNLKLRNANY